MNLRKPSTTSSWLLKNLGVAAKEEEERAEKQRKKTFYDKMKLEKAKLEQKRKYEKKIDGKKNQNINAKLPKLVVAKFKGIPTNWLRFSDQFTAEIDSADAPQVTKFSSLKDGLSLTTEGYQRAKNILRGRYGKENEIVTAYVTASCHFRRFMEPTQTKS